MCVKRAVVLVVTRCRLIEIYHPFFLYHEVRGGNLPIFMVETEPVSSSKLFVSFYQTSYPERRNSWELRNCVTDVQQHVACSTVVDEWDSVVPLNVHPFFQEGNRPQWVFKVNIAHIQQKP